MAFLLGLLVASGVAGSLVLRNWRQQDQVARIRDRARLKVIEGQMAALRASLRIQVAEHEARRRMRSDDALVTFASSEGPAQPSQ